MIRHVLFTGEIGAGKSTALRRMLTLLDADARGIETYSPEPRGVLPKTLFLRAYGSEAQGERLCTIPNRERKSVAPAFDTLAAALLEDARRKGGLVVIDEIGRLEWDARRYHEALRACLDGAGPVAGVLRKHQAGWADWIRQREDVLLLEVTPENREALPGIAAAYMRASLAGKAEG